MKRHCARLRGIGLYANWPSAECQLWISKCNQLCSKLFKELCSELYVSVKGDEMKKEKPRKSGGT